MIHWGSFWLGFGFAYLFSFAGLLLLLSGNRRP
jgi:hypothetical protein